MADNLEQDPILERITMVKQFQALVVNFPAVVAIILIDNDATGSLWNAFKSNRWFPQRLGAYSWGMRRSKIMWKSSEEALISSPWFNLLANLTKYFVPERKRERRYWKQNGTPIIPNVFQSDEKMKRNENGKIRAKIMKLNSRIFFHHTYEKAFVKRKTRFGFCWISSPRPQYITEPLGGSFFICSILKVTRGNLIFWKETRVSNVS